MLFTSFQYLIFLPLIFALYWLLPGKWRLPLLLLASYVFYMSWIPAFGLLIAGLTLFNWLWGKVVHRSRDRAKLALGIGVAVNLLGLAIFKYAEFAVQSLASVLHLATRQQWSLEVNIILPLGISFFTFEFIHYLFEIYRGQKPIDSFVLFALFAAFFPTQIAGPIKRYPDFVMQMQAEHKLRLSYLDDGIVLIVVGLAKKLLLADNLAVLVQMFAADPGSFGAVECWMFAYAFAFQIYFDFSGYTDIARGSAMLFGYHIPINFNMPYIASNISDFWRRWHISLSTWLRDYLFIPLGGSRQSNWKTNRNLLLTMALGGLWHGAAWNFVVWGIYHGVCLIAHRQFVSLRSAWTRLDRFCNGTFWRYFSIIFTFHVVCIGWVFFRLQDMRAASTVVKKMVLMHPIYAKVEANHFLMLSNDLPVIMPIALILLLVLLVANLPLSAMHERGWLRRAPAICRAAFCSILILAIVTFIPDNSAPFIYFQF